MKQSNAKKKGGKNSLSVYLVKIFKPGRTPTAYKCVIFYNVFYLIRFPVSNTFSCGLVCESSCSVCYENARLLPKK